MDTQQSLLNSAETLMRKRGYEAVSFGDLAQEVGIRKASIHYHFPKKADLAADLIARYARTLATHRGEITRASDTGAAALQAFILLYRTALEDGQQLCLCVAFAAARDSLSAPVLAELNRFHDDSLAWLRAVFERAKQDGSIIHMTTPQDEACACLALMEGAHLLARSAEDATLFDAATQSLMNRIT